MSTFLSADLHWGHFNIIRYCGRPFATLEEMHNALIKNWNARVKPSDTVIHVGDWCFKNTVNGKEGTPNKAEYWQSLLNGKVIFIEGNHDKNNGVKTPIQGMLLASHSKRIWCVHKPEHARTDVDINFVGHVHQNWKIKKYKDTILYNVGVDVNNFRPILLDEAVGQVQKLLNTTQVEEFIHEIRND